MRSVVLAAMVAGTGLVLSAGPAAATGDTIVFPQPIAAKQKFPPGGATQVGFDEPVLFLEPDPLAALAGLVDDVGAIIGPGGAHGENPYGRGVREQFAADGVIDPKE